MEFWSLHSSLYPSVTIQQRHLLEDAVRWTVQGCYDHARDIFQSQALRSSTLPIVGIEQAILFERMGLEVQRWEVLERFPKPLNRTAPTTGADEWDLLDVFRANCTLMLQGRLRRAVNVAAEVATRLVKKSLASYSDIDACCFLECLRIFRMCQSSSNWLENRTSSTTPESGIGNIIGVFQSLPPLRELRESLQSQQRYSEANMLVKSEAWLSSYGGRDVITAYESFLASVAGLKQNYIAMSKIATTRIFFAEVLAQHRQNTSAQDQVRRAQFPVPYVSDPRSALLIEMVNLELYPGETSYHQMVRCRQVANRSLQMGELPSYRVCLRHALREASKLVTDTSVYNNDEDFLATYRDLLLSYMKFEDSQKMAYFLSSAIMEFGAEYVIRTSAGPSQHIKLIQDWHTDYPWFDIPLHAWRLEQSALQAAKALKDSELEEQFKKSALVWEQQSPLKRRGPPTALEAFLMPNLDDDDAFQQWRFSDPSCYHNFIEISTGLIVRIVKEELEANILTNSEAMFLLQWNRYVLTSDHEEHHLKTAEELRHIDFARMASVFFGFPAENDITKPTHEETWQPWFDKLQRLLRIKDRRPSDFQRLLLLKNVQKCRCQCVSNYSMLLSSDQKCENILQSHREITKSLSLQEDLQSINPRLIGEADIHTSKFLIANAILSLGAMCTRHNTHSLTNDMLQGTYDNLFNLSEEFRICGKLEMLHRTYFALGEVVWYQYLLFETREPWDGLEFWSKAEELYRQMRMDSSILTSSRAFIAKGNITQNLSQDMLYNRAIEASMAGIVSYENKAPHPKYDELVSGLVTWCQNSKARAMTDLLGLTAEIPAKLMEEAKSSPTAIGLLAEEENLLRQLENSSLSTSVQLRSDLRSLRVRMRKEEMALLPILDLREGVSLSGKDLQSFFKTLGNNVVVVEWAYHWQSAYDLLMLVYRDGQLSAIRPIVDSSAAQTGSYPSRLDLTMVNKWVNDRLDVARKDMPLSEADATKDLAKMDGLVAPLTDLTKPGELLVFCPTRALHRVPMHALRLGGKKPLIRRNPIVYAQSLSILRLCHAESTVIESELQKPFAAAVFNTLGDDQSTVDAVGELSSLLKAESVSTGNCSKDEFSAQASKCRIIHVHGHVEFTVDSPLQHHLVLRSPPQSDADKLTADEIFGLQFRKPTLIMAMGCNSGRAKISESDDLLGLTAAFHCAGASAVVSTLWKVHKDDCMLFSKAFYGYLMKCLQDEHDKSPYVNLAVAMQRGIAAARESSDGHMRRPFHWAAFVLHGSWVFPKARLSSSQVV